MSSTQNSQYYRKHTPKNTSDPNINIKSNSNIDDIWLHIISECNIDLSKQCSYISSKQIKKSKETWNGIENQFEPRLLCKMDNSNKRPEIFKKNNISLISVENGMYALIKANIYIELHKYTCVPNIIRNNNNSILLNIGSGETSMLDNMLYNGILDDIIGEKIKYGPLLGGRHRCHFNTFIGDINITIDGSQYETDGCYETDNFVCIVEAKSVQCTDFNVRQLYYPFREVYKEIGDEKHIISLFIYKDKQKVIHVHKFKWENYENMIDIINIGYFEYMEHN